MLSKLVRNGIAKYVAKHCCTYLKKGYSEKEIAILCYRDEVVRAYCGILASEMKKSVKCIIKKNRERARGASILDSVH